MDKKHRKFSKSSPCYQKVYKSETLILGENSNVKNILSTPEFICPDEQFEIDVNTILQVSCVSDSSGLIVIDSLDIVVNGSAKFTEFELIEKNGCPAGTFSGLISPDEKAITLIYDNFSVDCEGTGVNLKCCMNFFQLVADESNEMQKINFDVTLRGFASLDEGCGGQFNDNFESEINIGTTLIVKGDK
ncbi:DUF4360 domain-containing protein [Bacillus cereus]|uniref:DUF4360 domain-containing protein n=1 Tax=Bacillus cereus TaxID=1396 RepID=UPI000279DB19|nr:DUF4360 domain-containing protein [Bacillus cereus]EJR83336.1 hypothetical protein IKA_05260 [Bacillus cereus VD169]